MVSRSFPVSLSDRMDLLARILTRLENTETFKKMRGRGTNTWVQFHPLSPEEAKLHRPIYLDMVEEGVIIYDKDNFMGKVLSGLEDRLKKLGAKRVFLRDGSWYWDLKPNIKKGEAIEV